MKNAIDLELEIKRAGCSQSVKKLTRFFKTGKGEYGEGDIFYGVKVPIIRQMAKKYGHLNLPDLKQLISSPYHEIRLAVLIILNDKFKTGDENTRKQVFNFYLANIKHINNWDLVDISAHKIVGQYLIDKDKNILFKLAVSPAWNDRRIAVVATLTLLKLGLYKEPFKLYRQLLSDEHDLIRKAVGWMLREAEKTKPAETRQFLQANYDKIPRTTLRYAIERFPERERQKYLKKSFS